MFTGLILAVVLMALLSVTGILLICLSKKERKHSLGFYLIMIMSLVLSYFDITASGSGFDMSIFCSWLFLLVTIASIFFWIKNHQKIGVILLILSHVLLWSKFIFLW